MKLKHIHPVFTFKDEDKNIYHVFCAAAKRGNLVFECFKNSSPIGNHDPIGGHAGWSTAKAHLETVIKNMNNFYRDEPTSITR